MNNAPLPAEPEATGQDALQQSMALFVHDLMKSDISAPLQVAAGELAFRLGLEREAEECFRRSLEIDPRNETALNNLGVIYWQNGEVNAAQELFQDVLHLNPANGYARTNLEIMGGLVPVAEKPIAAPEISITTCEEPCHGPVDSHPARPDEDPAQMEILRDYIIRFQPHCDRYLAKIASPRDKSVLVIGAGHGTEMLWCIRNGAREVIGIDISPRDTRALELALAHYGITDPPPFAIHLMSAEEAANLGRKFDLVLSNNVFEHISDVPAAFAACKKIISEDDGRIAVFTDPLYYSSMGAHLAIEPWEHLWNDQLVLKDKATPYQWQEYASLNRMRYDDFMNAIEMNGLTVLKHETVPDRNLKRLPEFIDRIRAKLDVEPADLTTEGIAVELCHYDRPIEQHQAETFERKGGNMTDCLINQELMKKAMPQKLVLIDHLPDIQSAIEFGGVWTVDMVYLRYAMQKATAIGIEVDNLHPAAMQDNIMYVQGDFRDPGVLEKIPLCDLVILYDIILHQVDAFNAFHSLVAKSKKYVVFHQPMFNPPDQALSNFMFYLPGNDLAKFGVDAEKLVSFKVETLEDFGPQGITNPNKWHWGMSLDLIRTWFRFLGFKIIFETEPTDQTGWLWKNWVRWGCVAERI